jgi:predicted protein tyrosine phosphatase
VSDSSPHPIGLSPLHALFVCSYNRMRSPTAEVLFADYPGVETMSAGTSMDAEVVISAELVEWADIILVMEQVHASLLREWFAGQLEGKPLVVLGIPDRYPYMDSGLVRILQEKVPKYLVPVRD